MRELRVGRTSRRQFDLDRRHLGPDGEILANDLPAARRLAARLNEKAADDAPVAHAGEIVALALLHEVGHVLVDRYERDVRPGAFAEALERLDAAVGRQAVDGVLTGLAEEFGPEPQRTDRLESLLLLRIALENPAVEPIEPLVDPGPVAEAAAYPVVARGIEGILGDELGERRDATNLIELLRAPARHSPTSLAGQLRYVRERWADLLPPDLAARLLAGEDLLAEESRALHLRFGGPAGRPVARGPSFGPAEAEPERFTPDREWMPRIVLIAKSTYVWLAQLSRRHGREIRTLDAIPDEELDALAGRGVTGLWLIGLWQRSRASERIKRMRGNPDAVASAYSLDDYRIADDLGGEEACAILRDRAQARGIRLASDMVPNHMGIDSRWVVEHPDWFMSLAEPPYPAYTYDGPNLADDERVEIRLEDHYWNDSDAAVVFERRDRTTGDVRYVYHGNDGTSFPWNDTAQLDFLKAEVREAVIQTILAVARRFPVIRFDAAMVLAKRHVQRLWYPAFGHAGAIPSRSAHAMSQAAFDAAMPDEFWREVVDRVATEAPDTLLLAEAFWLLEGYFVRSLGMHRVYNSAFMHMLRDEDNAGYRKVIRDTLEFEPEILQRYVNFMTNPDEETAIEQFGTGDKYFGVATLLATLPGLPMIGHGQIEGFGEKYGMEYRRPRLEEQPNEGLIARFDREIVPLLHERGRFAGSADFLLYDVVSDGGAVVEDVFAYSNGSGPGRSLVVYHNRYAQAAGRIHDSVPMARRAADGSRTLVRRTLAEGLGLASSTDGFVTFRDARSGLEFVRATREIRDHGLYVELDAYRTFVFGEFAEVEDRPDAPWSRLAAELGGRGVPSLAEAMADLRLRPVHEALLSQLADGADRDGADPEVRRRRFLEAAGLTVPDAAPPAAAPPAAADMAVRAALLLEALDRRRFDDLRLGTALARAGLDERAIRRTRLALGLATPAGLGNPAGLVSAWLDDPEVRAFLGVHEWDGAEYVEKEALDDLLDLAAGLDKARGARRASPVIGRLRRAAAAAGYRVDRLREALAQPPSRVPRAPAPRKRARRVPSGRCRPGR